MLAEARVNRGLFCLFQTTLLLSLIQSQRTLKSLSKMAFVTVDRHSGFNLLQAMVYEGNFEGVSTASIFLDDFVRELNFESTANNAKTFPSKTAHDMLSTLKKHDHEKIKRFCEERLEKTRTLTELHECSDYNDTEKAVELVLHHGLDVNSPAKGNRTPLLWASLRCSSEFIKTLIDLGAEANARREDKCTPLILATDWNNYMAVHLLTKIGADTDAEQMEGKAALHFASCRSANITQCLIESGCNVNLQSTTGRTPLHLAVQNKQKHVVKMLLENDADVAKRDKQDPNDRVILVRGKDKGKPAWYVVDVKKTLTGLFHKRVKSGSLDVADFGTVLASGWGTDPPDSKREQILKAHSESTVEIKDKTALHIACEIGDVAVVELLAEHGAVINAPDADGFTPLQLAAIRGNMKVVKRLVELKADVNLTTTDGKDAVDYAEMNEEVEIEEFLKSKKSLLRKFWNRLSKK